MNGSSPPIINIFFLFKETTYNLRIFHSLYSDNKKTVKFGTETITHRGTKDMDSYSLKYEKCVFFYTFKENNKNCNADLCPCLICKTYIQRVGFI